MDNPRRLDTCGEWCCAFDGVVELEEGFGVSRRGVGSAARLPCALVVGETREVLPIQEHEVVKAIPAERVLERIVESTQLVPVEGVFVSQMRHEIVEVIQLCLGSASKTESLMRWWIVAVVQEVARLVLHESEQQINEQIVAVPGL